MKDSELLFNVISAIVLALVVTVRPAGPAPRPTTRTDCTLVRTSVNPTSIPAAG